MRSETIRVKKPAWVRIVNPDPITSLDTTYRYGEAALVIPGGVFRIIAGCGRRVLAMYQAPHPPHDIHECPSDAMVFNTLDDLQLMAEGVINHSEPYDDRLPEWSKTERSGRFPLGAVGRVPKTRLVRAFFNPIERIEKDLKSNGPFRQEPLVTRVRRLSEHAAIRCGGSMTVVAFDDRMLRVVYRAAPSYRGEQLASGAWFRISEEEFLRMDETYRHVREEEALECAVIISLLRSL
ncbi:MAG TPA: hypothetical protein VL283_01550 [Candidatus Baltobacteraceae bacterium]|nr:hypothetical protein [Candidatus Baltobacteraceae bacterium]